MVKIKDETKWHQAIKDFGKKPKTPEDWEEVTALYRQLGGKITVKKSEKLYEIMNKPMQESIGSDLKGFLGKWITNPIVLGIAIYFFGKQLKKYLKK